MNDDRHEKLPFPKVTLPWLRISGTAQRIHRSALAQPSQTQQQSSCSRARVHSDACSPNPSTVLQQLGMRLSSPSVRQPPPGNATHGGVHKGDVRRTSLKISGRQAPEAVAISMQQTKRTTREGDTTE